MNLPVLDSSLLTEAEAQRRLFIDALRTRFRGQVRLDKHDRMLYATDASLYQVEPLGVLVPADVQDASVAGAICAEFGVPMLPRGGGTSLAGQCTNQAVVIDLSANCQDLTGFDASERTIYAQAGVKIDDINVMLTRDKTGLFYAPDPATSAQATVGGCLGNNASGSRSVMYGRTVDSTLAIDAITGDGAKVRFEPGAGGRDVVAFKLAEGVMKIVRRHEALIRERYPKTMRRNAGYALDSILAQMDAGATAQTLDLTKLLVGSEGTLCLSLGAKLKLFPQPKAKGLALMSFATLDEAIAAVMPILTTGPSAVELVDDVVVEAALNNLECRAYVEAFPKVRGQPPLAVLYVEYHTASEAERTAKFEQLRRVLPDVAANPMNIVTDAAGMGSAWKLRKAGEPLLHGLPGARKPLTFVEDNAVPVEHLSEFVKRFRDIVTRHGTRAAFYAHASVGVLHVRPLIDPHRTGDLTMLREIAVEVADLAKSLGGVMSGEHGDGKVRGPLLERFYGPELMNAFRQVKALFDPAGLFNPGNITRPGNIDSITQRLRIDPHDETPIVRSSARNTAGDAPVRGPTAPAIPTFYNYADQDGLGHAVEMCNGAGVCRKSSGGTMCPSYRGTMDERHATRGRGNALRLAITGQLTEGGSAGAGSTVPSAAPTPDQVHARFTDPATIETLDLCLSCKACKSECPSNVDIARLKAEYTAQRYKATGKVPLKALLTGHIRTLNAFGSLTPELANWANASGPMRALIGKVMNLAPKRSLPPFSQSLYRIWNQARPALDSSGRPTSSTQPATRPTVVLFADCFTTYNESNLGLAAKRLLESFGYHVELPKVGCCARSMISVGMLEQAIETIDRTIEQLRPAIEDDAVKAILVVEPSCLSAFKDDWLLLNARSPLPLRQRLAAKSMLVEQFLEQRWAGHPQRPNLPTPEEAKSRLGDRPVLLHAHCHQKALWSANSSGDLLKRVLGARLNILDTGCCGMAGSFGYDKDKYDLSMRIANLDNTAPGSAASGQHAGGGVLPHIRKASNPVVLATGTSCRHQIKDGTEGQTHAVHPVEFLADLLAPR